MESRVRIRLALLMLVFFIGAGTCGFIVLEGYPFLDAVYMTVITISTVGFGEIHTLSEAGRVFTVFLILSGVGSLAFAAQAVTEMMLERASNPKFKTESHGKENRQIERALYHLRLWPGRGRRRRALREGRRPSSW